jgi:hypothetical protein
MARTVSAAGAKRWKYGRLHNPIRSLRLRRHEPVIMRGTDAVAIAHTEPMVHTRARSNAAQRSRTLRATAKPMPPPDRRAPGGSMPTDANACGDCGRSGEQEH